MSGAEHGTGGGAPAGKGAVTIVTQTRVRPENACNVVSVLLLTYLVPWVSERFSWWLQSTGANARRINAAGTAVLLALYAVMVLVFWRLF